MKRTWAHFEKFLKIFISFLVLISLFSPLSDDFTVENESTEECIEKDNNMFDSWVKGLGHQRRVDHTNQGVVHVFFI